MNIQQYHMQSRGTLSPGREIPARVGDPRTQALFNLGRLDTRLPAYRLQQQAQGDVMREAPQQFNQPMPYQMPQQSAGMLPTQYQLRSPGLMAGPQQTAMSARRRHRPMGYRFPQRDVNGNLPGEWDYQQPPVFQQPPMALYGGYQFPRS